MIPDLQGAGTKILQSIEKHLQARREESRHSTRALPGSVEARLEVLRELRRPGGENFNVFRLPQVDNNEDKLHPPFIAELLDPGGSYAQGAMFLELFPHQAWRSRLDQFASHHRETGDVAPQRDCPTRSAGFGATTASVRRFPGWIGGA